MPAFRLRPMQGIESDIGWYQMIRVLGVGGNSKTYLAICTDPKEKLGQHVAIKFFLNFAQPERLSAFKNEFRFLSSCEHSAVLRVSDIGEYNWERTKVPFIVTEYLPNNLREIMMKKEASKVVKAGWATQLSTALHYLHTLSPSAIHRDVKPENVFIRGAHAILGDFGMMQRYEKDTESPDERTTMFRGRYRSPEQVAYMKGEGELHPCSDVFQLGLVLVELFSGQNPLIKPPYTDGKPDFAAPLEIKSFRIAGTRGLHILRVLKTMLRFDSTYRPTAGDLAVSWERIFKELLRAQGRLEGWQF